MRVDKIHPLAPNTLLTMIKDAGLYLSLNVITSLVELQCNMQMCAFLNCSTWLYFPLCDLCVLGQAAQASLSQNTNPHLLKKGCPNRFSSPMRPSTDTLDSGEREVVCISQSSEALHGDYGEPSSRDGDLSHSSNQELFAKCCSFVELWVVHSYLWQVKDFSKPNSVCATDMNCTKTNICKYLMHGYCS